MSAPADRSHEWFTRRLVDLELGLLEEPEADAVRAHLATCEKCRQAQAALAAPREFDDPLGEHIPVAMLARWDRARRELHGLEREAVAHHLTTCERCQEGLRVLGFEPAIDWAPAPNAVPPSSAAIASAGRRRDIVDEVADRARTGFDGLRVLLGGWAVAATALAVWLAVPRPVAGPVALVPPASTAPHATTPVAPGIENPSPASMAPSPAIQLAMLAETESAVRGEGTAPAPAVVRDSSGELALEIPADELPDLPRSARVDMEVRDPSQRAVARRSFRLGELLAHRLFVIRLERPERGTYRVTLAFPSTSAAPIERRFGVEVRAR